MRVLPVIDLKSGQVVRGIAGQRDSYRPIRSSIAQSSLPRDVARAFVTRFACESAYLADLDAIAGAPPAWNTYRAIVDEGITLWVDAGPRRADAARTLARFRAGGKPLTVIAGLESLDAPARLLELIEAVGSEQLVFSLDLHQGTPWTRSPAWVGLSARAIAEMAIAAGTRRLIVLDLAGVGMRQGVASLALCQELAVAHPNLQLTTGGGVRSRDDLEQLSRAGIAFALVASALHDGALTPADLDCS